VGVNELKASYSPPKLGGVAAPSTKCREATFERRRRGGSL
jgi:hypothetical protein